MIGRIPILDVQPAVSCGRRPAKAVVGETVPVSSTVFREGHEMFGAGVVLRDPAGQRQPLVQMRELAEGTDRYGANVTPSSQGLWHFRIEAWGDPIAHWRHDAAIKVPIGQDVDLMLAEGALLFDRAARQAAVAERAATRGHASHPDQATTPSHASHPDQATTPSHASHPDQATTPSHASHPDQATTPSHASHPDQATTPSHASHPDQATTPSHASHPDQATTPSHASHPDQATTPSHASHPDQATTPSHASHPDQATTPSHASHPDQATTPSHASHPDQATTPSHASHPDQATTPSHASHPDQATTPSQPDRAAILRGDQQAAAQMARKTLEMVAARLRETGPPVDRLAAAFTPEVTEVLARFPLRDLTTHSAWWPLIVHRQRALFGSWYEFFPRSEGAKTDPSGQRRPVSGTLRTAARRLDEIAAMGFDVAYLSPVHPIGTTARKGRNNALTAGPDDPGSPWAIGSPAGGHDAINPDLGTMDDFDAFVARAAELGLEVALDLALQASPDHPWVSKHPDWFTTRADGTIAYAENPPKKYQDIYPLNFDNDPEGIYAEVLRVVRLWISHGIRIFRVDNPHTKPLPFWDRLLAELAASDPDVIFLAEAFTRPAMMHALAEIGFHQSYTYFTWRHSASELTEYLTELSGPAAAYMRPNFFVNTPDILSEYLQHAGPAAFKVRAVLAAMLSPSWGIYCGFELGENSPLRPGSEEYLNSEKYQYRPRDWAAAKRLNLGISPFISQLNAIRRSHPALQQIRNLRFHFPDRPEILCFSKTVGAPASGSPGGDTVLVVVNLDPHQPREATVWLDGVALGIDVSAGFTVTDELTGEYYRWGQANYVRLDPGSAPAHIFTVTAGQPDGSGRPT